MAKPTYHELLKPHKARAPHDVDKIIALAKYYNDMFDLPENLVPAAAMKESDFDYLAKSPTGPLGLMQMGGAARFETGVTNPFDPEQSLMGGAAYYRHLMDNFKAKPKTLKELSAMYTEGPGAGGRMVRGLRPYNTQAIEHFKKLQKGRQQINNSDELIAMANELMAEEHKIQGNPMTIDIPINLNGYSEGSLEQILRDYGQNESKGLSTKKYMELPKKAREILERFKRLYVEPSPSIVELPEEFDPFQDILNSVNNIDTVPIRW
jgi:hypothetical protein